MQKSLPLLSVCLAISASGAAKIAVKPLGVVLATQGAKARAANFKLVRSMAPGELLFPGDLLLTSDGGATIAYCPKSAIFEFESGGEFQFSENDFHNVKGEAVLLREAPGCDLPATDPASTRTLEELARKVGSSSAIDPAALTDPARFSASMEAINRAVTQRRGMLLVAGSEPPSTNGPPPGPTYALVVGISRYEKLPKEDWLRFADADANKFGELLTSPRGGGLPADQLTVLTNERATKDAIREQIDRLQKLAAKNRGSLLLVLAAHGVADEDTGQASIVTHESNPEDLYASGLAMDQLQEILSEGILGADRLLVYVDVCHAARLGTIRSRNVNRAVVNAIPSQPAVKVLSFLSSRETEASWEGENWGGHGAFSYFILRGLNGDADADGDGTVTAGELVNYVSRMVTEATLDRQHPNPQTFTLRNTTPLSVKVDPSSFTLPMDWQPLSQTQVQQRKGQKNLSPPSAQARSLSAEEAPDSLTEFRDAIRAGRILPGVPGSAFEMLRGPLRSALSPALFGVAETELRIALENQGQRAILRYLEGDQVEQRRETFQNAATNFEAARRLDLQPGRREPRELFCRGRELIFAKTQPAYADAVRFLEDAARADPRGAYSFNALGIAYLEQAAGDLSRFDMAIAAFEDAIRLAPHWVYPRHNLALAYAERGQYDRAIRAYREAMKWGPDYSYLAYNLGLLYQRLNRLNDAEEAYREALKIAESARAKGLRPGVQGQWREGADIYNGLASIEASRPGVRHAHRAEELYRRAIQEYDGSRAARHNLALLLSRAGESAEAETLWARNLAEDQNDLASRLARADYLERHDRLEDAVREYELAIGAEGSFPGIRRKLAAVLLKLKRIEPARAMLVRAMQDDPSPNLLEELGDLEVHAGQTSEALARYRDAEAKYRSSTDRSRVKKKQAQLATAKR
jgi:tetratricopeptide (TPR) repeat protein